MECLEKLAKDCAEKFYSLPEKQRQCSIVVEGGTYSQRQIFMNYLRLETDVFVISIDYSPNKNGNYKINLDDF